MIRRTLKCSTVSLRGITRGSYHGESYRSDPRLARSRRTGRSRASLRNPRLPRRSLVRVLRTTLSASLCILSRNRPLLVPCLRPLVRRIPPRGGTGVGDVVGLPVRDAGTSVICRMRETLAVPARRRTRSAVGKRSGARRETRDSEKRRERTAERESREGAVDFRDSACFRRVASAGRFDENDGNLRCADVELARDVQLDSR